MSMGWIKKLFSTKKRAAITLLIIIIFFAGKHFLVDSKKTVSNHALVKRGDIKEELTLSGQIDAQDHAVLVFGVPGKIYRIGAKEGDWIKKGQEIAALDAEVLNAALREAWQNFTAASAASEKYYDGRDPNKAESYDQKIERTAIDTAKNNAYDNVRIAQKNLESAVLYSPIDGLVIDVNPDIAGVNVSAMNSNYEIVNPSTLFLKVTADQTEVGSIKKGKTGSIVFDSYPEEQVVGKIKDISFTPDRNETGTVYDVKVMLPNIDNSNYKYRLGMTADVNFVMKEAKNILIIPSSYIKPDGNKKYVLLGKDKKKTYVEIGIENDQDTEIKKGLSEGDMVYD
jgi:membrane fusion protein, macrolide-specific efflux system